MLAHRSFFTSSNADIGDNDVDGGAGSLGVARSTANVSGDAASFDTKVRRLG
jgi:hypothetical protein